MKAVSTGEADPMLPAEITGIRCDKRGGLYQRAVLATHQQSIK
jgi:hypothetical protein